MGKIIKDGVEHFFFGGGSGSGDNIEIMTRAEYDALVEAGTVDADVYYFITDAGSGSTGNASDVVYDNTESGLTATDVQGAVDELNKNMGGFRFYEDSTGKYVVGADSVPKKLGSGEMVLLKKAGRTTRITKYTFTADYDKVYIYTTGLGATGTGNNPIYDSISITGATVIEKSAQKANKEFSGIVFSLSSYVFELNNIKSGTTITMSSSMGSTEAFAEYHIYALQ